MVNNNFDFQIPMFHADADVKFWLLFVFIINTA